MLQEKECFTLSWLNRWTWFHKKKLKKKWLLDIFQNKSHPGTLQSSHFCSEPHRRQRFDDAKKKVFTSYSGLYHYSIFNFQFGQLSVVKPNSKFIKPTTELKGNSTELKVYRFQFPLITMVGIQRIRVKSIWNEFWASIGSDGEEC